MSTDLHQFSPRVYSGRRVAFALASWSLASVAVCASFLFAGIGLQKLSEASQIDLMTLFSAVMPLLAWLCLAVMTTGWIKQKKVHWAWPIAGTIAGLFSAVIFLGFFLFFIWAVPLSVVLVRYHLSRITPNEPDPS